MSEGQFLIAQLNEALLGVFGHGIHTCIVIVALWATFFSKQRRPKKRHIMVSLIVFLYICATVYVASDWVYAIYYSNKKGNESSGFVCNLGYYSNKKGNESSGFVCNLGYRASMVGLGIITGTADGITIWRCWIVWGRRWPFVIPPILLLLAQVVCGCFAFQNVLRDRAFTTTATLNDAVTAHVTSMEIDWMMMYLSFSLGTTLWCTTLIIYRILTVKQHTDDNTGTCVYCRPIEILVESASLHAVGLIGWMVLININAVASLYAPSLHVAMTAISPTLIVARVASGNARPDDDWQAYNGVSSLRFGSAAHSTVGSELSADIDSEHGGSGMTDGCEPENDVDTEKGVDAPKSGGTEGICDHVV
ncbi:hypothetical protein ARMGADRAFT_1082721 [Armillaria gallica]|uniref:Uncharacterized protein n=1 Tax=Armillaria gallica TaxID=47427 RepID=A0A2H3DSQ8_ARMGA|nr:hypothetical protein ARMGADRAFT_1082721 [Armillaria gallica]